MYQGVAMVDGNERRNSGSELSTNNQGSLESVEGVGGRRQDPSLPPEGGGSLDNCMATGFPIGANHLRSADPRLDELRDMGVRPRWLHVAATLGVDAFLTLWRMLDEDPPTLQGSSIYVSMPRFSRYLRYQRNRYIETLVRQGFNTHEIQKKIRRELCEDITDRHIDRVSEKLRKNVKVSS